LDPAIRLRYPRWHRIGGRVVGPSGLMAALTGLWMTVGYAIPAPLQGALLYGVRIVVGLAMLLAIAVSVRAVLQGRITQHRAWMVRAYALGQGAGTQVLIMLPLSLIVGVPTFFFRWPLPNGSFGAATETRDALTQARAASVAATHPFVFSMAAVGGQPPGVFAQPVPVPVH
jgi:Predicted membrane protein (DUF2306)